MTASTPVPVFGSVEPAIAALGHAATYAALARSAGGARAEPRRHRPAMRREAVVDRVLAADPSGRWLTPDEIGELLAAYHIPHLGRNHRP